MVIRKGRGFTSNSEAKIDWREAEVTLDCQGLTSGILNLQRSQKEFDQFYDQKNVKKLRQLQESMSTEIEKLDLKNVDVNNFILHFLEPNRIERFGWILRKYIAGIGDYEDDEIREFEDDGYLEFQTIFADFTKKRNQFGTRQYQSFLNFMKSPEYLAARNRIEKLAGLSEENETLYLPIFLNAIFLDKLMEKDSVVTLSEPPPDLNDFFGAYLTRGKIVLERAGNSLGYKMRGGVIVVSEADSRLGNRMSGGKIFAETAGVFAGDHLRGGYLHVGEASFAFASEMSGGLAVTRKTEQISSFRSGNVIFDRVLPPVVNHSTNEMRVWHLQVEELTFGGRQINYLNQYSTPSHIPVVHSRVVVSELLNDDGFIESAAGMFYSTNITRGMYKGILLLRSLPDIFGENMTGGVIIVERANTTIEQVREKIAESKSGGAILLRVYDTGDEIGRLVDVEDEPDWEGISKTVSQVSR
ncbi:MAG: hypothetical protein NTW50_05195 [Candidatus Berkelbacteria bacterium]|nr:hypothetical protein [Candidatus Berkelbacteria bacterium]